ncbi:MAG: hypothetical protein AB4911_01735 [Oscillochloridaceae bacterium umkhey_bin13]
MPPTNRGQRRRQPVRTPGAPAQAASVTTQPRRPTSKPARAVEPPDYSRDYADVRRDLRMITIISSILLVGMIGASFVI